MPAPSAANQETPRSMRQALRFDGLWWRQFARLGCVYGPDWWKRYSPPVIAAILFLLLPGNRRGATANLRRILGTQGWWRDRREALRLFVDFAHCFTELHEAHGPRPAPLELVPPEDDLLAAAVAEGRGAIIATAHFGNSGIATLGLERYGRPITMVMAQEANPTVWPFIERQLAPRFRIVHASASPFRSLTLLRALRDNELVGIQFDTHPLAPGATPVEFFGEPAGFHMGPFLLARASGAPLLPVFIVRTGRRRYEIRVLGRYNPRTPEDAVAALHQVVAAFQEFVRTHPHQWFQFADYWARPPQPARPHMPPRRHPPPDADADATEAEQAILS